MNEINIILKNIDEIIPYDNNPRNNDDTVEFVANSIKEFGFKVPIILDKNNVVVTGHTRLKAAKQLGLKEIPVIYADDLTDEQIKAFRIADNKTSEKSSWDLNKLKFELDGLDFDMTDFGFGDFELSILTDDMEPEPYDDKIVEQYSENSDDFLENRRVIITYKTPEETAFLKKLIKEETDNLAVVYKLSDIMRRF